MIVREMDVASWLQVNSLPYSTRTSSRQRQIFLPLPAITIL